MIPAPKIEEVDDDGNAIRAQRKPPRISWRRIWQQEGSQGLWRGWGCRVLHETLWRAVAVTGWELLLYTPGNQPFAALGKLVLAMSASCLLFHPLHVVETRTTAGCYEPAIRIYFASAPHVTRVVGAGCAGTVFGGSQAVSCACSRPTTRSGAPRPRLRTRCSWVRSLASLLSTLHAFPAACSQIEM